MSEFAFPGESQTPPSASAERSGGLWPSGRKLKGLKHAISCKPRDQCGHQYKSRMLNRCRPTTGGKHQNVRSQATPNWSLLKGQPAIQVYCMNFHPCFTEEKALEVQSARICILEHEKYHLNINYEFSVNHLVLCTAILDRGAGLTLFNAKLLFTSVLDRVRPCTLINTLMDAINWPLAIHSSIDLFGAVGTLKVRVSCIVINQLETGCILGTLFIETYFRSILPRIKTVQFQRVLE